ncbi:MAG: hypothetical protein KGO51_09285 [Alphaproteobacteria bacterium]|nr:hypothetical protein [Alphaproteobacteria bacterium]
MRALILIAAALGLSACADYGYVYCYDPLHGPTGYAWGPFQPRPACASPPAQAGFFQGPNYGGWREPWYAGPYPATAYAVPAAARAEGN